MLLTAAVQECTDSVCCQVSKAQPVFGDSLVCIGFFKQSLDPSDELWAVEITTNGVSQLAMGALIRSDLSPHAGAQ